VDTLPIRPNSAAGPASTANKQDALRDRVKSLQLPRSTPVAAFPWRGLLAALIVLVTAVWLFRDDLGSLAKRQENESNDIAALVEKLKAGGADPATIADLVKKLEHSTPAGSSAASESATTVNTIPSSAQQVASSGDVVLESKGYVIPAHQILVSPKVTGMVRELNLEEGASVREGDILAVLENDEFKADYNRALANLDVAKQKLRELENGWRPDEIKQAEAELAESKAQLLDIEPNYQRVKELVLRKVATDRELQQAESLYLTTMRRVDRLTLALKLMREGPRVERIDQARAEVHLFEAELAKAEWRLSNCTIRAPISGTILKKNAERGNVVNAMAFNGSFSLCELADLSDLEIDLAIQERDVSRIFKGQKCRVRADAWPDRIYEGYVSRLMPIADRAKGAVPVRVKVTVPAQEQGQYLKPEMSAIVSFYSDTKSTPAATQVVRPVDSR
jgi:HlyD family secretion protein